MPNKPKVLITTVPFADKNRLPLELLEKAGIAYQLNPYDKKLTEDQLAELVGDFDALIAGTEVISAKVMSRASQLKFISRVGIGLDGVDLLAAREKAIKVSYTPDAPAPAVADLTLAMMLSLLRSTHFSNAQMHQGKWQRIFGRRLGEVTVGIIGVGRIGTGVLQRMKGFGMRQVLVHDLKPNHALDKDFDIAWVSKEQVYREADVISLHVPLTHLTREI